MALQNSKSVPGAASRNDVTAPTEAEGSSSSDKMDVEDYYSGIIDDNDYNSIDETVGPTLHSHRSPKDKAVQTVMLWLEAKVTDSLEDTVFNSEKSLIELFCGTIARAMPSSAPVDRLFSLWKDINRAQRSSLSDESFNILMFTKGNMNEKINLK